MSQYLVGDHVGGKKTDGYIESTKMLHGGNWQGIVQKWRRLIRTANDL